MRTKRPYVDPTPREIRRAKLLIRRSWKSAALRSALKLSPEPWKEESDLQVK